LGMKRHGVRKPSERLDAVYLASATPLERFIIKNGIKPAHLAARSGYCRQHVLRIRMGRMEPTRRCMAAILAAMRSFTRKRITVLDLFTFDDGPVSRPYRQREEACAAQGP
jgi:hypothetical protein